MAVLIIGGAFYVSRKSTEHLTGVGSNTTLVSIKNVPYTGELDANGNGTPDWEEELSKNVFEKIATPEELVSTSTTDTSSLTYTDRFARSFFEDYFNTQTGNAIPQTQEEFVNRAVTTVERETSALRYTRADVITTDDSDVAIRAYGNAVGEIVLRNSAGGSDHELLILQRAMEERNAAVLTELLPIQGAYEGLVADARALPAPVSLANQHRDLINAFEALRADITAMQLIFDDPLYAYARLKRYDADATNLYTAFYTLYSALTARGVVYASDEPAYFLYIFDTPYTP
ncbi:hypothetical protein KC727_00080 [Candidatus Kaiserbacteria bacterium]|nr:hypothetical protein [Candidatus Kaiserbacteria bacterium]